MGSHDQCNIMLDSRSDRYRGVFGQRDVLFVNQRELERRGLRPDEEWTAAICRTDNGPSTREPHESD
jgi:hypothetical protein